MSGVSKFSLRSRRGVMASLATVAVTSVLGVSTAQALPAFPAIGELAPWPAAVWGGEKPLADRELTRTTADGWVLHVRKSGEVINVAPPLDSSVTTGEAFGTVNGAAWIEGAGDPELSGALFETGYQIGCGVDVSGGADVEVASTVGVASHATTGIEGGPSVQVELPNATGVNVGADVTAMAETGVESKAELSPTVAAHINPGKVTNVALVSMPVSAKYKRAAGGFTGAHLQVNGCAGPVTIRSYVQLVTTSATSTDSVAVYGDPQRIR